MIKGMIRLKFAYDLNLTALTEHGTVEYLNSRGSREKFDAYERFHVVDYATFAETATNMKLYSIAIDFLRECQRILPLERGHHKPTEKDYSHGLKILAGNVAKLNNGYLTKRQNIAGIEF
jgi:preprotein translocase subunit Sss1